MTGQQFLKATPEQLRAMMRFLDVRVYSDADIDEIIQWVQNGDKSSPSPGYVVAAMQMTGRPR